MNWNGRQYKGAMRDRRKVKREEAEQRNALTPEHRRRANRKRGGDLDGKRAE